MKPAGLLPMFLSLLFFAFLGLWRFSEGVRTVAVIGLFFSGATVGAALVGVIITLLVWRNPTLLTRKGER